MIQATGITKSYSARRGIGRVTVRALRGVDIEIPSGGAVSIIGESGCGKTTLGRILAGVEQHDGGEIVVDGKPLSRMSGAERRRVQQRIQLIHQDPYSALNPTRTIEATLRDALRLRAKQTGRDGAWVETRMRELLELVGLDATYVLPKYPHQLSGGQRQRLVIARALTVDPEVLVADEAVSMIDVSLRLGILRLLRTLRTEIGVSVLFVTHDVATARYIGEDSLVYVLYRGAVVERGLVDDVITAPEHPYTQSLLSAIPVLRGIEEEAPESVLPSAPLDDSQPDEGCLFAARCPFVRPECEKAAPSLTSASAGAGHEHRCLFGTQRTVVALSAQ